MKQNSFVKKRIIHLSVIVFLTMIIIITAVFFTVKYNVEGETNLPFILTSINVVSTAESNISQDEENIWHSSILQKNDIYFKIEKNSNYTKEEAIKKISFDNFQIVKENDEMIVNIYRPTVSINSYTYSDEYKIDNILEYVGAQSSNSETLQINNQGGLIGFSTTTDNLGEYMFSENEKLPSDGKLLALAGVKENEIKFKILFDLIIETESNHKFKANIVLDMPAGNILENGVGLFEYTDLENIVFKRF